MTDLELGIAVTSINIIFLLAMINIGVWRIAKALERLAQFTPKIGEKQ